jgi:hypothetical protein
MRCPGRPCKNNQGHCWRDPHGGKHYKLLTAHMRKLVAHMNAGNTFESHHDVPDTIRQQLYAEADQRNETHRDIGPPHPRMAQVQMNECSPASQQGSLQCSPERTPPPFNTVFKAIVLDALDIPGSQRKPSKTTSNGSKIKPTHKSGQPVCESGRHPYNVRL